MVPLCYARNQKRCRVCKTCGASRQRLEELGFVPREEIELIACNAGSVIVAVRDARYALDKCQARNILVEEA